MMGDLNILEKQIQLAKEQTVLLHSLGYSNEQIRDFIATQIFLPLQKLDKYQDSGLIDTAELEIRDNS